MHQHIIELADLTKQYGDHLVVDHLSLSIPKGEIFGLLGPNGAGKSTTILMLLGLTEPTSGSVRVCGIDPIRNPIEAKRRVGYLPEDVGFYEDYTGLENLIYTGRLNGLSKEEAKDGATQLLTRVGLADAMEKKAGKYSRGMRQRLGLADVLIKHPDVIVLDEPTLGIDPKGVRDFLSLIVQLSREEKLTVLLSSHDLHQMQRVCDRVGIFVQGKLVAEGNLDTLSQTLFSSEPFTVEAGVIQVSKPIETSSFSKQGLLETLRRIDGVTTVTIEDEKLEVGCLRDVAPDIARAIVEAGGGLSYLHKKEYGLDDIYHHYFEGGITS